MALWNEIGNRLAWLFRRSRFDRELDEEMRFHIQTRAEELQQDGLSGADAPNASAARVRFHAAEPGRVSQPSCHDPGSLVQISVSGNTWIPISQYRFLEETHAFDGLAGMNIQMVVNWRDGKRSYRLAGTRVTDNFFEVVGIPVAMGRPIERSESDVAVVTHGIWTKHLGGDANVVGRTLALDGKPYTVIGVLPRDHRMLAGFGFTPDLYLTKDPIEVMLYARLPRGMTRQAAYARLKPICRELDRVYPDVNRKWAEEIRLSAAGGVARLEEDGQAAIPVVAFFGMLVVVTAIVVLIACANVALVAGLATVAPTARALRVDPAVALRHE